MEGGDFAFAITVLRGDVNQDGVVTSGDVSIMLGNFGQTSALWADGDMSGDGKVSLTDLGFIQSNMGTDFRSWPSGAQSATSGGGTGIVVDSSALFKRAVRDYTATHKKLSLELLDALWTVLGEDPLTLQIVS